MGYNSVESVFNEAVIDDVEDEAYSASQYGDAIDLLANMSDIDISLRDVSEGVSATMVDAILGDDEIVKMIDDEIAQDDSEYKEDEGTE